MRVGVRVRARARVGVRVRVRVRVRMAVAPGGEGAPLAARGAPRLSEGRAARKREANPKECR